MRIELDVELLDKPGQLIKALEPISRLGGNLISVIHLRETLTKRGRVPVHIIVSLENLETLETLLTELEENDVWVHKVDEVRRKKRLTILLIGHVVDTDIRDTIDRLNNITGVLVADMSLSMPHPEKETSALMDLEISNPKKLAVALDELDLIAREKELTLVKSLEI